MSTVSPQQIANGAAITSSGVNTPINQLANVINGNIDDSNISSVSGTKVSAGTIPVAAMATAANPETRESESQFDFVASGLVWSGDAYGSTRAASMTAGTVYVNGRRTTVSAVTARTFTASRDTYVDVDNTGTLTYTEVTNNAASPALAANNVRIAIIVTGASSIAAVGSVNQGQENKVLPIVSSVPYTTTDSLGNLICPRDPQRKILGYRQIVANAAVASSSLTQIAGLSVSVIVPLGRKIKVTAYFGNVGATAGGVTYTFGLFNGVVGVGTNLSNSAIGVPAGFAGTFGYVESNTTPGSGSFTFNAALAVPSGTGTIQAAAASPAFIKVELA